MHLLLLGPVRRRTENRPVVAPVEVRAIFIVPSLRVNGVLEPNETRIIDSFVHVTTIVPAPRPATLGLGIPWLLVCSFSRPPVNLLKDWRGLNPQFGCFWPLEICNIVPN